jgi:DNA-binding HxlR family transcriptional regulator
VTERKRRTSEMDGNFMNMQDLLHYRASIPILLTLLAQEKSYKRELEMTHRMSNEAVTQGLRILQKEGLITIRSSKDHSYVQEFYYLTKKGKDLATAFEKCDVLLRDIFAHESE